MMPDIELDYNDMWKVYVNDDLYAILIPIGGAGVISGSPNFERGTYESL